MNRVAYSDWINFINAVKEKGVHSLEFEKIKNSEPIVGGAGGEKLLQQEITKLEIEIIYDAIGGFEKAINLSIEEADLYILEKGLRDLKQAIADSMFFDAFESLTKESKDNLKRQIAANLYMFIDEFSKFMKKLSEEGNSLYVDEFLYIYKKANIRKFIQESVLYE